MWSDAFIDCVEICAVWSTYIDIGVFEPKPRVDVGCDFVIGLNDVFDVEIDKVVERIYVLFDETFYFEECGEKKPFVLRGGRSESTCVP